MRTRTPVARSLSTLALGMLLGASALAADPVTDAIQGAYGPYRTVLFRTNSGSQAESQQALERAQTAWKQVMSQFGARPPAPYDRDPGFAAALAEVNQTYVKSADEIAKNKLTDAHETLEHVRDVLAQLRQRNQVIVFSDHMNAYHAQMEHVLIEGPKLLAQPEGLLRLAGQAGVLAFLARQLGTQAPPELAGDAEFTVALKAVEQSVADVNSALLAQDAAAVKAAIGKVKVPYSKMFLKFG